MGFSILIPFHSNPLPSCINCTSASFQKLHKKKKEQARRLWMFVFIEKALLAMVALRILSGSIEIGAALLMLKFNDLHKAFTINSLLAFVGPTIFFSTTAIGLVGLSGRISPLKAVCLIAGVLLIGLSIKMK
jgi:hypothetical protein